MSSIERRVRSGRASWRVHYRTLEGQQRNRSFARKADAERFLTSVDAAKLAGGFVDPARGRAPFTEMADLWRQSKVNLKASTLSRYDDALEDHVLPRWGPVPVSAIEFDSVQAWIVDLVESGMSAAHVVKIHGVLSGVLDRAVRGKRITANPARGVTLPRVQSKPHRYLTVEQAETMAVRAAQLPPGRPRRRTDAAFAQYRLVVLVLSWCGLRWSEMAALRVASVNVKRRRLSVSAAVVEVDGVGLVWGTPKSWEARTVPVEPQLAAELAEFVKGRDPGALLFTAPDGGVLRNRNARRAWFDRAAVETGAPGLTPHELRHTAASLAVSAGANIKALQRMLGHKSAAMTLDTYSELFDDDLEAVGERLGALRARAGVAPVLPEPSAVRVDAAC